MGRNKAFLELGGRPLVRIVVDRLMEVCSEILIVTGEVGSYAGLVLPSWRIVSKM